MKVIQPFCVLGCIVFMLQACSDDISKARVKTFYKVQKNNYGGQEYVSVSGPDTFYYTPEGKYDYSANGNITRSEKRGNIIDSRTYDRQGGLVSSSITFLDEHGRTDSFIVQQGNRIPYIHKYVYNAAGDLIEDRQYADEPPKFSVSKFKVVKGNRIEESYDVIPDVVIEYVPNPETGKIDTFTTKYYRVTLHYDYYTDKLLMPSNANYGNDFPETRSRNLKKTMVQLSPKGDTEEVYLFNYAFDKKGRVVTEVETTRNGTEYDSVSYTYY